MNVFIEIPAWSFKKIHFDPDSAEWDLDFNSPFPCPFNYGFCQDERSADGEPLDVIVIGPRLRPGDRVEVTPQLRVDFIDTGWSDPKLVARLDGQPLSQLDLLRVQIFMTVFTAFKRLRALARDGTLPRHFKVRGYEWLRTGS